MLDFSRFCASPCPAPVRTCLLLGGGVRRRSQCWIQNPVSKPSRGWLSALTSKNCLPPISMDPAHLLAWRLAGELGSKCLCEGACEGLTSQS